MPKIMAKPPDTRRGMAALRFARCCWRGGHAFVDNVCSECGVTARALDLLQIEEARRRARMRDA